ncbi:hypothetical protein LOK49_LG05G03932 [Camellia lanceoleosa]|uniref:Uncharacterized protein n=1 Tax=Camellia lanceoleosa TaxID=1840588 RepID=A0ACC0HUP7_9ERIC|nr:hypothetical protein LOK49_LG05G03932 [Camellia lanceoleosa]
MRVLCEVVCISKVVEVGLIKEDTTQYEGASLRTEDNHGVVTNRKESMIPRKMRIKTVLSDANITFLISDFENDMDLVELDRKVSLSSPSLPFVVACSGFLGDVSYSS